MRNGLFGALALVAVTAGAAGAQDSRFALRLTFDPAAVQRLTETGERVMLSAWYAGDPAGPDVAVDETGQVWLGEEQAEFWPGDQMLHLGGTLARAPLAQITEIRVNINVFSARRAHEDNVLDCGLVEGTLASLQAAPPTMNCRLLGD